MNTTADHVFVDPAPATLRTATTTPARNNEDLPLPDGPTTAISRRGSQPIDECGHNVVATEEHVVVLGLERRETLVGNGSVGGLGRLVVDDHFHGRRAFVESRNRDHAGITEPEAASGPRQLGYEIGGEDAVRAGCGREPAGDDDGRPEDSVPVGVRFAGVQSDLNLHSFARSVAARRGLSRLDGRAQRVDHAREGNDHAVVVVRDLAPAVAARGVPDERPIRRLVLTSVVVTQAIEGRGRAGQSAVQNDNHSDGYVGSG